jgi:hypothetical protein
MPMKIGGAVFTITGLVGGIISLFFISLGLYSSPGLRNSIPLLITFILPAIIAILLIYLTLS